MQTQVKYLSKSQVTQFFKVIPIDKLRDRALFDLIYRHGLRRVEATWLQKDWIHNGRIWIKRAKNGISQEYQLHPASIALIGLYLNARGKDHNPYLFLGRESGSGKPISDNLIYHLFRNYSERAGIPKDRGFVHILRHSIAVHLLDAGWDLIDVKDWLGHVDIKSTTIYARVSNKRRERQFQRLLKSTEIAKTITDGGFNEI